MGVGDEIVAAGQAYSWWRQHRQLSVICDMHGRPRSHPIWDSNPCIVQPRTDRAVDTLHLHRITNGPHCRPYIVYPFTEETGWTFNKEFRCRDHVAKIYLTPDEQAVGDLHLGLGPYIAIEPWSKHPNLRWPMDRWVALVALIRERLPDLRVVQHVHQHSLIVVEGVTHAPMLTFRQACGLVSRASCYIRGESGMCHAAAALGIPQVTIWGGCMDWEVMGGYPKQVGVGISEPCCGAWKACEHCRRTMEAITPETVLAGLLEALRPTSCASPTEVSVE